MSEYGVEPIYEKIEFCRNAWTLWGKIQSGRWDWLGIHPDGQFVLGSPRQRKGFTMMAAPEVVMDSANRSEHGVRVSTPLGPPRGGASWYRTEQQAREEFRKALNSHGNESKGPELFKVQRIEQGSIAEEELIVRRPPTYR
jgi:hypothetical protein